MRLTNFSAVPPSVPLSLLQSSHAVDEDIVWGVAFRIDPEKEEEVKAYLEHREKNGYTPHVVPVFAYASKEDETEDNEEVVVVEKVGPVTIFVWKDERS